MVVERAITSILIVEDDEALRGTLLSALESQYSTVMCCANITTATELVAKWLPDLLILDVALPDGSAFDLLGQLSKSSTMPLVVAMSGQATAADAFRLAQLGVHGYLEKPFGMDALRETIEEARSNPIDIQPGIRDHLERFTLQEVESGVRKTMLEEALARAKGSRRGAARMLQVSRQVIQYMLRNQEKCSGEEGES